MKTTKIILKSVLLLTLASCASKPIETNHWNTEAERFPASGDGIQTCSKLAQTFLLFDPKKKIVKNVDIEDPNQLPIDHIIAKGFIMPTDRVMVVKHPSLDWYNKVMKSLLANLKMWNMNRYPIFYMTKEVDYKKIGAKISELLEKKVNNTLEKEDLKLFENVMKDIEEFSNYKKDIEGILNEKISLMYNIEMLMKIKLGKEPVDVKITIKTAKGEESEIVTLRKEDKNRGLKVLELGRRLDNLNGKYFVQGKLNERLIKQAHLYNIVTIYQREVEYAVKNNINSTPELEELLEKLNKQLANADFEPSSYGVFRADRLVLDQELKVFLKIDKAVAKIERGKEKTKSALKSFFNHKDSGTEREKMGLLENMYVSISELTVSDLTRYGIAAGVGFGVSRYFWVDKSNQDLGSKTADVTPSSIPYNINKDGSPGQSRVEEIPAPGVVRSQFNTQIANTHQEQMQTTQKVEDSYLKEQYQLMKKHFDKLFD